MGLVSLYKGTCQNLLPLCLLRTHSKVSICKAGRRFSPGSKLACSLILDFPDSRTTRKKNLFIKLPHPWYFGCSRGLGRLWISLLSYCSLCGLSKESCFVSRAHQLVSESSVLFCLPIVKSISSLIYRLRGMKYCSRHPPGASSPMLHPPPQCQPENSCVLEQKEGCQALNSH